MSPAKTDHFGHTNELLVSVGTIADSGPDAAWEVPAGIRTLLVDCAKPGLRIQKKTVLIRFLRQHKHFSSLTVTFNDAFFFEPIG